MTGPILDAAREALLAGLSVVPPAEDGSKRPMGGWKRYQRQRPTPEDLQQWYGGHGPRRGIGLVCGAVSGGLELLEFENAEAYAEFVAAAKDAGLGELVERVEGGYLEESPGGGRHWLYRCPEIGGNTKLARRPGLGGTVEVLIETRGEGGYVVCAPSAGKVHPSGRPYVLVAGGFSAIARISASERAELFRLAQTFDRMPRPQPPDASGQRDQVDGEPGGRPGDDLERRVPWAEILEPHGWRMLYRRSGLEAWQRPGKTTPGISATIGHARGEHGEPRLYVFSTSTPFESERSYTKLGALAVLEHGGDYQAAAKALRAKGYGGRPPHAPPDAPPPRPVGDRRTEHNGHGPAKRGSGQGQDRLASGEEAPAGNPPKGSRYGIAHSSSDPGLWAEQPPQGPGGRVWPLTDWGNAQRLVFYWGNALRYCHLWRKWLVWDGCRWCVDDTAGASRLAKDTARRIFHEAAEVAPTDDSPAAEKQAEARRKAILAWAFKTQASGRLKAMLELAASEPGVPVLPGELDRDSWALNVRNGTVDLRTGQLRPHRRADLLTKLAPVDYQPDAPCPTWERFLARVMNGDEELPGFLRRAVGYSCTGDVSEEILFLLHGVGANGKSKFLETVQAALGQYAQEAPGDLLLSKRRGGVPNDVARLMGARFVASIETGEGESLDEGLVKHLTGGDTVTARYLYGEFFEFAPTHKLWLSTNHKPSVLGTDEGIWRRIMLVPFTAYIPPAERDKRLLDKLRAELPGVLAWIVRGAVEWQRVGLRPPAKVTEATAAYRAAQDDLGAWIEQRCIREDGAEEAFKALYDSYTAWAAAGRLEAANSREFGQSLTERGFNGFKKLGRWAYRSGIRLGKSDDPVASSDALSSQNGEGSDESDAITQSSVVPLPRGQDFPQSDLTRLTRLTSTTESGQPPPFEWVFEDQPVGDCVVCGKQCITLDDHGHPCHPACREREKTRVTG